MAYKNKIGSMWRSMSLFSCGIVWCLFAYEALAQQLPHDTNVPQPSFSQDALFWPSFKGGEIALPSRNVGMRPSNLMASSSFNSAPSSSKILVTYLIKNTTALATCSKYTMAAPTQYSQAETLYSRSINHPDAKSCALQNKNIPETVRGVEASIWLGLDKERAISGAEGKLQCEGSDRRNDIFYSWITYNRYSRSIS